MYTNIYNALTMQEVHSIIIIIRIRIINMTLKK